MGTLFQAASYRAGNRARKPSQAASRLDAPDERPVRQTFHPGINQTEKEESAVKKLFLAIMVSVRG
jgi:hypothetical protein